MGERESEKKREGERETEREREIESAVKRSYCYFSSLEVNVCNLCEQCESTYGVCVCVCV